MPFRPLPTQSTDSAMYPLQISGAGAENPNGLFDPVFPAGVFFNQFGAPTTANASTATEVSLLNTTVTATAGYAGTATQIQPSDQSTNYLPPYTFLNPGTHLRVKILGTLGNTGTPTLRIRTVLKNAAGTVVFSLTDSGVQTTTAVTANGDFTYNADIVVTAFTSPNATVFARSLPVYQTNVTVSSALGGTGNFSSSTVPVNVAYYLDVLVTWGSSSASNLITPKVIEFSVVA